MISAAFYKYHSSFWVEKWKREWSESEKENKFDSFTLVLYYVEHIVSELWVFHISKKKECCISKRPGFEDEPRVAELPKRNLELQSLNTS